MKILGLIYFDGIGGAEKFILHLAKEVNATASSYDVLVILPNHEPKQKEEFIAIAEDYGVTCHFLIQKSLLDFSILRKIDRIFRSHYNLINSHLHKADLLAVLYKKLVNRKSKIVSTKHGYTDRLYQTYIQNPEALPRNMFYYFYKFLERQMDASYSCSYGLKNFLVKSKLNTDENLGVIQHGFDYPSVETIKDLYPRRTKNRVLMLGRLHKIKGHHFTLKALASVEEELDIELILLGDGDEKAALIELAQELNIVERVSFLGFQEDIYRYLCASDLLIVTSYVESLPLMILEAFNAELTVLGWDISGINELVKKGETGILVEAYDIEALSTAISDFFDKREHYTQLSINAKKLLLEHFNADRMVRETIGYFEETMG